MLLCLSGLTGGVVGAGSLIREDGSDAPAFPGRESLRELWAPSDRSSNCPGQPFVLQLGITLRQGETREDLGPSRFRGQHNAAFVRLFLRDGGGGLFWGELHHQRFTTLEDLRQKTQKRDKR